MTHEELADVIKTALVDPPRCGDHVYHRPSGETLEVAYADVERNRMSWAGWPDGTAELSDCDVVFRCSDEEHEAAVDRWRASKATGPRRDNVLRLYAEPDEGGGA